MSYLVDISETHPSTNFIISELRKQSIDLGRFHKIDLKVDEENIIASIIGIKPTGTCELDGGCTLDKGLKLGICHFSGILTLVILEEGNIEKEVLYMIRTKLESLKFLVLPLDNGNVAFKCFLDTISKFREYYVENRYSERDFLQRRDFREGIYKVVAKEWNKFFFGKDNKDLLKKA